MFQAKTIVHGKDPEVRWVVNPRIWKEGLSVEHIVNVCACVREGTSHDQICTSLQKRWGGLAEAKAPIRGLLWPFLLLLSHSGSIAILEIRPHLLLICFPLILDRVKLRFLECDQGLLGQFFVIWLPISHEIPSLTVEEKHTQRSISGTYPSPFLCQPLPSTIPKTEVRGSGGRKDNSMRQATKELPSTFSDLFGLVWANWRYSVNEHIHKDICKIGIRLNSYWSFLGGVLVSLVCPKC